MGKEGKRQNGNRLLWSDESSESNKYYINFIMSFIYSVLSILIKNQPFHVQKKIPYHYKMQPFNNGSPEVKRGMESG